MFKSEHVNTWADQIDANAPFPHRLICVTDDAHGLHPRIEAFPMPDTRFEHLGNPYQDKYNADHSWGAKKYFPSCYRRLWNFSAEAKALGDWIFALDIDIIVTGDLTPLLNDASFTGWCDEQQDWNKVAGGAYLLKAGAHTDIWTEFDPDRSPQEAVAAGFRGSDQSWISYKLYPPPARWGRKDGLIKINWGPRDDVGPRNARLVFTSGHSPPWDPRTQRKYPWVCKYWKS